jgi:Outer membrane protein beta-barrel domain
MTRGTSFALMATFIATVSIPSPAHAETFLAPWLGADTGGRFSSAPVGFGVTGGTTLAGVVGVDVDFGYSPDFFGNGVNGYVLTTMGNVTIGIPFDRVRGRGVRPYLTAGLGLVRTHVSGPRNEFSIGANDPGVNFGGGLTGFINAHVGVRADFRQIRSLNDDDSSAIGFSRLRYWRSSLALVLK